jgi:photosystem II stability/assembly factor-like uncharacterized protein
MIITIGTAEGLFVDGRDTLPGHRVTALDTGWALVDGSTVMHATNGGWRTILTATGEERMRAILSLDDEAIVGRGGSLVRVFETEQFKPIDSFDNVAGRDDWHAVGSSTPYVRSLSVTADGVLLANVHVGGIPRSTDGGATWEPTIDVDADVHEVRAHPDRPELVLAAAAIGLCRSEDGGASWNVHTDGLHATYCRAVALAGDVLLVSASTGPFTEQGALYRRAIDSDGPFERCAGGLPEWQPHNVDSGCVATNGELVIFGGADGIVYASEDAGRTWRVLADDLPPVTAVAID